MKVETKRYKDSVAVVLGAAIALSLSSRALAQGRPPAESVATEQTNVAGTIAYPQPPAGFDPLAASDADLAQYGFPPRPDEWDAPDAYAHWQKMVSTPQKRLKHPLLQQTTIHNRAATTLSESETVDNGSLAVTSSNWSGYADVGAAGTFKLNNAAIYSEYIVPIAQQPFGVCTGSWDYSSQWVGFDGFNSGDVLQAGTEVDAYCSGSTKSTFYGPWYEWYPYAETRITNLTVAPGNVMGVEVWYTTATPSGHAYLINYSTNTSVSVAFSPPSGTTFIGNSAEWIVEAPTVNGGLAALTNYVADPFNADYVHSNNVYYYPGSSPAGTTIYSITMNAGSKPLSVVHLYGNDTLWFYNGNLPY